MNESALEAISKGVKEITGSSYFVNLIELITQIAMLILLLAGIYYLVHIGNRYVESKQRIILKRKQLLSFMLTLAGIFALLMIISMRSLLFNLLTPFIVAIVLAYILNPLVKYLNQYGIKRFWGVLIVYLAISVLLLTLSLTIFPKMGAELRGLLEMLPEFSHQAYEYFNRFYQSLNRNLQSLPPEFGIRDLQPINADWIQQVVLNALTSITNSLLSIFSSIFSLVLIPVLTFYFLKDAEMFKKTAILMIPIKRRKGVLAIFREFDEVLGGFIRGQLIIASFVGIMTTIALFALRVNFAVIVGIIVAIANVIPYFGPVIGIIPGVFFALLDGPMKALWVIVIFTIIQQIESGILSPKIVGASVGIHPVWVILALVVGGKFFGLLGLIFAVPAAGVIKVLGKHTINYIVSFK
ncbi:AI-2E family transporter [Alkaliphilus crotonatoxidans]